MDVTGNTSLPSIRNSFPLAFLVLAVFFAACGGTATHETKFVSAYRGLALQAEPDRKSATLRMLPYGTEVTVVRRSGKRLSMDGEKGEWVKISGRSGEGWVFDGFLASEESVVIIRGNHGAVMAKPFGLGDRKFEQSEKCDEVLIRSTFGRNVVFRADGGVVMSFGASDPEVDKATGEIWSSVYHEEKRGRYRIIGNYIEIVYDRLSGVTEERGQKKTTEKKLNEKEVCVFASCTGRDVLFCNKSGMFVPASGD